MYLWGKQKGKGKVCGPAPQRERDGAHMHWVLPFMCFISLAGDNLRGGLRGGFQQNIHSFSRCALLGQWSLLIGLLQVRGSLVIAAGPGITHLVLLLFWAWS